MRVWACLALPIVASYAGTACGPSFQVVYEGDLRFEHCYALDENPNVLMQQKSDCWSDWLKHYTYGQTRDRVEFAAIRFRAISRAGALPTDEAIMGAAPGEAAGTSLAAPAPTNAFAPPPQILVDNDGGATASLPLSALPIASARPPDPARVAATPARSSKGGAPVGDAARPPGAPCVESCGETWQSCRSACGSSPCAACDSAYGRCAHACFSSAPGP